MTQPEIADRVAITQAMADALPDYLMSDTLYQNMAVQTQSGLEHPVLTLGALLENLQGLRWHQAALSPDQQAALAASAAKTDKARAAYAGQWAARLRRELKAQLDSWKWYLDDLGEKDSARRNYPVEAHNRTRIGLLLSELGNAPDAADFRQRVAELDSRLRQEWQSGPYVGPRGEEGHYPPEQAWWLYGRPGG